MNYVNIVSLQEMSSLTNKIIQQEARVRVVILL
jgi:hypothetical protein